MRVLLVSAVVTLAHLSLSAQAARGRRGGSKRGRDDEVPVTTTAVPPTPALPVLRVAATPQPAIQLRGRVDPDAETDVEDGEADDETLVYVRPARRWNTVDTTGHAYDDVDHDDDDYDDGDDVGDYLGNMAQEYADEVQSGDTTDRQGDDEAHSGDVVVVVGPQRLVLPPLRYTSPAPNADEDEDLTLACDDDVYISMGHCVCNEDPCFHDASLMHLPRGREVPALARILLDDVDIVARAAEKGYYEYVFDRESLLAPVERAVSRIDYTTQMLRAILTAPIAEDERGWGTRAQIFVQTKVRDSVAYGSLNQAVTETKQQLMNVVDGPILQVGIVFIRAATLIDFFIAKSPSFQYAGWESDVWPIGHSSDPAVTLRAVQDLRDRILWIAEPLAGHQYVHPLPEDLTQAVHLLHALETGPTADVATELTEQYCPNLTAVLRVLKWIETPSARMKAKLTVHVFRFCGQSTARTIEHANEYLYAFRPEFETLLVDPANSLPVTFRITGARPDLYVNQSKAVLLSDGEVESFPFGIRIEHIENAELEGDGLIRDWLVQQVKFYFRVYDPSNPDTKAAIWEFSDGSETAIRPRSMAGLSTPDSAARRRKLTACGRLLGIGLRYGIVPGIRLSPASLALLQSPRAVWDMEAVGKAEDAQLWTYLDRLPAQTNWTDADAVETSFGEESVRVNGINTRVTPDTIVEFVRQKKFAKVVSSIEREMDYVRVGIENLLRPAVLDLLSPAQLAEAFTGPATLTPETVIAGFGFKRGLAGMEGWLVEILEAMSPESLGAFLVFVTGSAIPPLWAGDRLWMRLDVSDKIGVSKFPTAQTCFGVLTTPLYPSKDLFEDKLEMATSCAGSIDLK